MTEKINLQEWSDHLTKILFEVFKFKPLIFLQTIKINEGAYYQAPDFKIISWTKSENMTVHARTVGLQKDVVKIALKYILTRTCKDIDEIYLQLVIILSYLTDENMDSRLKQVAVKWSQIRSNIKTHELDSFNNIDNQLSYNSSLTLRNFIMDVKAEDRELSCH